MTDDRAILLVDDEKDILDVLEERVKGLGRKVFTSVLPQDALTIAKSEDLDVAVLDYHMPQMNGLELFEKLREIHPTIVAVFLTAHGEKGIVQKALKQHVFDFIDKPCDFDQLLVTIQKALVLAKDERVKSMAVSVTKMMAEKRKNQK